ncbi:bifunctional serine/threonine-protein kinase/ABC transporter substrate-binding protein [Nodularia spumigena CS-591/04]|uniref:bifunctional serine/threonine-protein kinase/ABC transporter substrate-binding protein n=1 Tax=Nodularia spumigena TaxID=70799 RepID=UPI00232F3A89|nr:bifunctional serine/threonine-protein kinase/ABC transporter substrate-binding protein [Nodularia spumigena]MDB9321762.1 bifunctional serine/threonine-protein kinase/ABC transporter substrate-binding protein [Nodularia spumigena CS-591/07A]MDB9331615.1 bifunctional serine/threonine-protein kinase/ABC transporter substrate-binding protein [Nodularia spumigena CS-591/04]MDB9358822.1 bifunctional serine/threonine-protein kinase/ABC transporter substrate-binding protein [Nodularia spumigena CS-58
MPLYCQACGMPLILQGRRGRYQPLETLAQGGFGATFKAIDLDSISQRLCVLKRLDINKYYDPKVVEGIKRAFEREAKVLESLGDNSGKIPTLYDSFCLTAPASDTYPQQELNYLVQQYIEGEDLSKELKKKGRFSQQEILDVLKQILPVLQFIHEHKEQVIHRDIKPSNIVRERDTQKLVLIDFGAVKQVVRAETSPEEKSIVFGTPAYAPPEQRAEKKVYPSSDLYALAASCVQLLTGQSPDNFRDHNNQSDWRKQDPQIVDENLANILDRMLRPHPGERFQSASEVRSEIDRIEELDPPIDPPTAPPTAPQGETQPINKKFPLYKLLLLVGITALLGLAGWVSYRIIPPPIDKITTDKLISVGDNLNLEGSPQLSGRYAQLKSQGIQAFADGSYDIARNRFTQIRTEAKANQQKFTQNRQSVEYKEAISALHDPLVLIYKNNAIVRLRHQSGQPIYTIAAVVPLTNSEGQAFNIGREMLFGIAQAQDKAVGAELPNVNLEVVIANDRNNREEAKAVAQAITKLRLNGRSILAVVGHYLSDSTCEAMKHSYNNASLVVVSPLSTKADMRKDCGESSLFFRTVASTGIEAKTLVNQLVQSGLGNPSSTVAIFYRPADPFSKDLFQAFKLALGRKSIQIVQNFDLDVPEFDAEQALKQVPDVNALIVIPDGRNGNSNAFDRALEIIRANAGNKIVLGSNPLYNYKIISPSGGLQNLKTLFLATDWHRQCAPESFVAETEQKYWFGSVNRTTASSYEAIQVLLPTLTGEVTSPQIREKLDGLAASGNAPRSGVFADGKTISFDENGDRQELTERILITVAQDLNNPFVVVGDCP